MSLYFFLSKKTSKTSFKVNAQQPDPQNQVNLNSNFQSLRPIFQKWSRGESLTREEYSRRRDVNLADLAKFTMDNQISREIAVLEGEPGTVLKVNFNLKNSSTVLKPALKMNYQNYNQYENPFDFQFLSYGNYNFEFFFVVVENQQQISWQELIEKFFDTYFTNGVSWFYPEKIFLESISFTRVYPTMDKNKVRALAFGQPGRLNERMNPCSARSFIISLTSNFIFSSRNAFQIRLPKTSINLDTIQKTTSNIPFDVMGNFVSNLENPLILGNNQTLGLKLCVKTSKEDSPLTYFPVDRALPLGYLGPNKELLPPVESSINDSPSVFPQQLTETSTKPSPSERLNTQELNELLDDVVDAQYREVDASGNTIRGRGRPVVPGSRTWLNRQLEISRQGVTPADPPSAKTNTAAPANSSQSNTSPPVSSPENTLPSSPSPQDEE